MKAFHSSSIFDGKKLHSDSVLLVEDGLCHSIVPIDQCTCDIEYMADDGVLIAPAYVDLQVNGGGGVMFNDSPDTATLEVISSAHSMLGTLSLLPTLISDVPEKTRAAIDAVTEAVQMGLPGILGLHLEGPHLDPAKKGAHEAAVLRPMNASDLSLLLEAKQNIPVLKLTFAPGQLDDDQIARLLNAGIVLSLGHSNATGDQCRHAFDCGVNCVTHLYNAMSQMTARDTGLVGATLVAPGVSAGLIADGIHVAPDLIEIALRAKKGPGKLFLVSDSMATAGSDQDLFHLNGRAIKRTDQCLRLEDGTLAGAHLALTDAVLMIRNILGCELHEAHSLASYVPASIVGSSATVGILAEQTRADFVCLNASGELAHVYRSGVRLN